MRRPRTANSACSSACAQENQRATETSANSASLGDAMLVSGLIHSCENLPCTNQLPVACGGKNRIPECVDKWSVAASKNEPEMTGVPFAV